VLCRFEETAAMRVPGEEAHAWVDTPKPASIDIARLPEAGGAQKTYWLMDEAQKRREITLQGKMLALRPRRSHAHITSSQLQDILRTEKHDREPLADGVRLTTCLAEKLA